MKTTTCSLVALAAASVTLPALAEFKSDEFSDKTIANVDPSEILSKDPRLARADQPFSGRTRVERPSEIEDLEEVVVTAQKRNENLQDVPVPVTVLNTDKLANSNQVRFEDYYASVPGVSIRPSVGQSWKATIRGLSSGDDSENPTVAVTIDDMPFGAATRWGGGQQVPDVDPGDLARIEVLRGPQGTLYGASSLGGLIKFVTIDPSTDRFSGRVQIAASGVKHGSDTGYAGRGSVNIPFSEGFALRASAFTRQDPGYIDNIMTGERDVNDVKSTGGRLSAVWHVADVFTAKFSAHVQRTETGGGSVGLMLGDEGPTQAKAFESGSYTKDIQVFGATLTANVGAAELTSVTAYSVFENKGNDDVGLIGYKQEYRTHKLSEELRLAMPLGERVDWMLGAFYTNEDPAEWIEDLPLIDAVTHRFYTPSPTYYHAEFTTTHQEYALFSSLMFQLTDDFDLQVAAREAHYDQDFFQFFYGDVVGNFNNGNTNPAPYDISIQDDAFTYLVTPRLKITPDLMVYARFTSGYRTGSPNSKLVPVNLPVIKPDTTRNYELGIKGDFFDRKLIVDASLYYIEWDDIQSNAKVRISTPQGDIAATAIVNGPNAKSQGVELSLNFRPLQGLNIGMWIALNDATLTEDVPTDVLLEGHSGDRLPDGSRFSGHFSVEQQFALGQEMTGYVGGAVSYQGRRYGAFVARGDGFPRAVTAPYAKTDLSGGVRFEDWDVNVYCNNAFDRFISLTADPITGDRLITQPRLIGMSVTKTF